MDNICILGQVYLDITTSKTPGILEDRLGGIIHAARTFWALHQKFFLYFISPNYLDGLTFEWGKTHIATRTRKIGNITDSPNIVFINEQKEIGNQGYQFPLYETHDCKINLSELEEFLILDNISEIFVVASNFPINEILQLCKQLNIIVHIDFANINYDFSMVDIPKTKFETVFLSTSSEIFKSFFNSSVTRMQKFITTKMSNSFIFKENRGGSRLFQNNELIIQTGALKQPIIHSVGIGDCFDAVFLFYKNNQSYKEAMAAATWFAGEYGCTKDDEKLQQEFNRIRLIPTQQLINSSKITISWDDRGLYDIYIAAPDFDYLDTSHIDYVSDCLKYHNFSPRLPVRENGQVDSELSINDRKTIFAKDYELLSECKLLLAILIDNDPGTFIEIGLAKKFNIPVIVYDPNSIAKNLMLTELPNFLSSDLEQIISEVFDQISTIHKNLIDNKERPSIEGRS